MTDKAKTADPAWIASLSGLHDQVWQRLLRGVADRRAPARHPTLATVGLDGGAEARTVVLRAVDRSAGTLEIHTDALSGKVAELQRQPRAALHVWDSRVRLQMRLRVTVAFLETANRWQRIPPASRLAYGGEPAPGSPLRSPHDYRETTDPARFLVLSCKLRELDVLHLGGERHRRARFDRVDDFVGVWLAP